QLPRLGGVYQLRGEATRTLKIMPVPEKKDEDKGKLECADCRAGRNAGSSVGIAASLHVIPNFPQADKNQDKRPVRRKNRPGIESRPPVGKEEKCANHDEENGNNQRRTSGITFLGHGTPPLPVIRTRMKNSSANQEVHFTPTAGGAEKPDRRREAGAAKHPAPGVAG